MLETRENALSWTNSSLFGLRGSGACSEGRGEKNTYFDEIGAFSSALLSGTVGGTLLAVTPIRPHVWQAWRGAMVLGGGHRPWQQAEQAAEARFLLRPFHEAKISTRGNKFKERYIAHPPTQPTQDNGVASNACANARNVSIHPTIHPTPDTSVASHVPPPQVA